MGESHVGPYPLDGVAMPAWLLRFGKDGGCRSPRTREMLLEAVARERPERLIFFSHGWNNDFAFAGRLYSGFLGHLERARGAGAGGGTMFVGAIWPSTLMPGDPGPVIAAGGPVREAADEAALEAIEAAAGAEEGGRLRALAARPRLAAAEAEALALAASGALKERDIESEAAEERPAPDPAELIEAALRLQSAESGAGGYSDDFGGRRGAGPGSASAAGLAEMLDPRNILRVFTVYQMKDRAGRVGSGGVHRLLRDLLALQPARVHAAGHSYGAKVMLSAACAGPLARPLQSLLLLQPAVSHLCFAAQVPGRAGPGGYRAALDPARVVQPILSTYSRHDKPLHDIFHLALRRGADLGELGVAAGTSAGEPPNRFAALGGYGPRGADELLIDPLPLPGEPMPDFGAARVVGLDGTLERRIGGHGDVATPLTAALLARQMALRQGG